MRRRGQRSVRVPYGPLALGEMPLPPHVAEYVCDVLRLVEGDTFTMFDPEARQEADVELLDARPRGPTLRVLELRPAKVVAPRRVTLIQGMAKGDKMDAIVRDATELGVTRFVPVIMERSIARPADGEARAERLRRIAREAARQCGRGDTPAIELPTPFESALRSILTDDVAASAFCLEPRAPTPLRRELARLSPDSEVIFLVGPEGGFSDAELALCRERRARLVSMGPLILRTETVCAAALGALLVLGVRDDD